MNNRERKDKLLSVFFKSIIEVLYDIGIANWDFFECNSYTQDIFFWWPIDKFSSTGVRGWVFWPNLFINHVKVNLLSKMILWTLIKCPILHINFVCYMYVRYNLLILNFSLKCQYQQVFSSWRTCYGTYILLGLNKSPLSSMASAINHI